MKQDHPDMPIVPMDVDANSRLNDSEVLLVPPVSLRWSATVSAILILGFAILVTTCSYTRRESVKGRLLYASGSAKVYTPQDGVVSKMLIREGETVQKGQQLAVITVDINTQEKGETRSSIERQLSLRKFSLEAEKLRTTTIFDQERDALIRRIDDLERARAEIRLEIQSYVSQVGLSESIAKRYQDLTAQGFAPPQQTDEKVQAYFQKISELHKRRRDAANLDRDFSALAVELKNLPEKVKNQLASIERSISELETLSVDNESKRELIVLAPQPGRVTAVLAVAGQMSAKDAPLLTILPLNADLEAELYVPSKSIGFVNSGLHVLLRYEAYPYQKFGEYGGTISEVALTSLTPGELKIPTDPTATSFYKVRVKLDQQIVNAYARPTSLQDGMVLDADILLDKRVLYEWVLEPVFGVRGYL